MQEEGVFPANFMKQWEDDTGAYPSQDPDFQDPLFLQKLLAKLKTSPTNEEFLSKIVM